MGWFKKAITQVLGRNLRLVSPELGRWMLGGLTNYSGKAVTVDTALGLSTVHACSGLLSETIATLPIALFEDLGEGKSRMARDHPLYPILHDQPNADMTAVEFWQSMLACLILWGNALAEIEWSGRRVVALTPLRPEMITVRRDADGFRVYRYATPGGPARDLTERDVFHLKGSSLDGLWGLSRIGLARNTLGLAMAAEESAGRLFANGMQSGGFFTIDQVLTKTQRDGLRGNLTDFMGSANAGKNMILEAGMKYQALTLPPLDAQLLQTRGFSVEEICRWFRVPPFMVGHTEKVTSWGSGLEQQVLGFLTFSLRPYLKLIEQAVKKSLIAPAERQKFYAEFNIEGLLRADSAGRAALYSVMAQNGVYTRNEIRARENLGPIAGGDDLTVQSNLLPIGMLGQTAAAGGDSQQARAALQQWLGSGVDIEAIIEARVQAAMRSAVLQRETLT